jgi:hypothetical protein
VAAWPALARLITISAVGAAVYWGAAFACQPREMLTRLSYLRRTWRGL